MDCKDMDVLMEKKRQVSNAVSRKTGNRSIPDLRRIENTTVKMTVMAKGLRSDQKKPKIEFL
jgi:hypothetical protein